MTNREHIKRRKIQIAFEAIAIEGGVLSPEWFSKIAHLQSDHQKDSDYKIPKGLNIRDEIGRYYRISQGLWSEFNIHQDSKKFVHDLLKLCFCFDDLLPSKPVTIGERIYPVTHSASEGKIPIVISNKEEGLDSLSIRFGDENRRRSAFGLVQEYLNASDDVLWGIVSQGESLRILRDNSSLTKPAWIEADLKRIFEEDRFADFAALWLLLHRSRFGEPSQQPHECVLEQWREASRTEGIRAQDHLRIGVEEALQILGQGFISHPNNKSLRDALQNGALTVHAYFQELLRLVYRLIFLLTIEERGLLHAEQTPESSKLIYSDGYSVKKLRDRSIKRNAYDRFGDLWEVLKIVFKAANKGEPKLGIPALGGLFSESKTPHLDQCYIENRSLLAAVYNFTWLKENSGISRVNWRDMGPEELGSVYESLLELVPQLAENGQRFCFATANESKGNERKLTGSYYTPDSLVQSLLDTALEPVIEQTIKNNSKDTIGSLLNLKIIDPACGSGHFLLAAARRLAAHIARIEVDGTPSERDYRKALRQVIAHCIYGVDLNPMAVELCKVALWLEAVEPGKPLTFLDHHIKHGNSLLGVTPKLLKDGLPDGAFTPITGDDKKVCSELKKKNKKERESKITDMFGDEKDPIKLGNLVQTIADLNAIQDDNLDGIHKKEQAYHEFIDSGVYKNTKLVCDAWCAAFVWEKTEQAVQPLTTDTIWQIEISPFKVSNERKEEIIRLAELYHFFHYHLEFPDVFSVPAKNQNPENVEMGWNGGFDVVLGNPPWEKLKIMDIEFFAKYSSEIATATTQAKRSKLIQHLIVSNPRLHELWVRSSLEVERSNLLIKSSELFKLTGLGELNTYALFAEIGLSLIKQNGSCGMIVKSSLFTGTTYGDFFSKLIKKHLLSLYDFKNWARYFPSVGFHERYTLMTLCGERAQNTSAKIAFQLVKVEDIIPEKIYKLSPDEIELFSPISNTCPLFTDPKQKELALNIYKKFPIIGDSSGSDWNIKYTSLYHMSADSELFVGKETVLEKYVESDIQNCEKIATAFLPLYEGKFIQQYDHRFSTYAGIPITERYSRKAATNTPSSQEKNNPHYEIEPRYWVRTSDFEKAREKLSLRSNYFVTARLVTNVISNARSVISCITPQVPCNNLLVILHVNSTDKSDYALKNLILTALLNAFVFDFFTRLKMSENLLKSTLFEIPAPRYNDLNSIYLWPKQSAFDFLKTRSLELSCTTGSLKALLKDLNLVSIDSFKWDSERRFIIKSEIDALLFHVYGLSRKDVDYIMDTFPIVKRRDEEKFNGEYRTKNTILQIFDAMADAIETGKPYQTLLDPPPADPRVAHQEVKDARRSM